MLLIGIIIFLLVCWVYKSEIETFVTKSNVCNSIDGRCYDVVKKFDDPKKASQTLANLNLFCLRVMKFLRKKYLWDEHPNKKARDIVQFLLSNYNPDGIIENAPAGSINTSYVDNKGKEFGLCLREKQSGDNNFHNMHDLHFVALHEMAHMANLEYGHGPKFWEIFKFILHETKEANLHEPRDYAQNPMNYCSLMVTHNPYFDETIQNII